MALKTAEILNALLSHAKSLGVFGTVTTHEPKNAPTAKVGASIWLNSVGPYRGSGLDSTSARVEFSIRIYKNMLTEPQDDIDKDLLKALDALMTAYSGNFTLDVDKIRAVDLLGMAGEPMSARAGYMDIDGKKFRVLVLTLPLIVDDVWSQAP